MTEAELSAAHRLIEMALAEDLADRGDVTSVATIPAETVGRAEFIARTGGTIAGLPIAEQVCASIDPALSFTTKTADGKNVRRGKVLAIVSGPMRSLLTAERTALNFLQRLSGVATLTQRFVKAAGDKVQILDTRKTTPGWRLLEKYAVRCGGGLNHRVGLYDGILIKDNHLAALGGGPPAILAAVTAARQHATDLPIEVEVDSRELFTAALAAMPDIILLDNMSDDDLAWCAAQRSASAPQVKLEASGGIALKRVKAIAATGVDRISVGALTHSAPALDIALDYHST